MYTKHISIAVALIAAAAAVSSCGPLEVFAQEVLPEQQEPVQLMPPQGDPQMFSSDGMMPPPQQGEFRMMPPPPGGAIDGRRIPPPPFPNGQGTPGQQGQFRQPPMGQPMEGREMNQRMMPPDGQQREMRQPIQGGTEMQNRMQGGEPMQFSGDMGEGDDFEAREAAMQKQRLEQMKRNMRGAEQGLAQMQKSIDRLTKKGIAVPSEYTSIVTELTTALATIKAATEYSDEVEAALEAVMDKGEDLRDIGPRLGMLEQWPKMLSQAEKQMKRLTDGVAKAKKKKGIEQYAATVSRVEASVAEVGAKYAEIKQLGASGDLEMAMDSMQELPELMQEAQHEIQTLEQLANLSKMVKATEKDIATFEKQAARISKKGADVSALTSIITEAKAKVAELKALGTDGSADPEDFFEVMQSLDELRREASDTMNALMGKPFNQESAVVRAFRESLQR